MHSSKLKAKKNVCNSCGGTDHKRFTNKLCPKSYRTKQRNAEQLEELDELKECLDQFENCILKNNITVEKLAPAYCSNWMTIHRWDGNTNEWKLEYNARKKLIDLHYNAARKAYRFPNLKDLITKQNYDISTIMSENAKIIFGIVGSNAGDIWYNHSWDYAHHGTVELLEIWGVTIPTKERIC